MTFAPSIRRIYARPVRMTLGFRFVCPFAHQTARLIRFVCLGPELCLWLLSHSASLRRSCHSARGSCHRGPQRTFTSKSLPVSLSLHGYLAPVKTGVSRHAWRTKQRGRSRYRNRPFASERVLRLIATDRTANPLFDFNRQVTKRARLLRPENIRQLNISRYITHLDLNAA